MTISAKKLWEEFFRRIFDPVQDDWEYSIRKNYELYGSANEGDVVRFVKTQILRGFVPIVRMINARIKKVVVEEAF